MINTKIKKIRSSILTALVSGAVASPLAFADDIEIYTGTKNEDSIVNIMFLLDTSGSMDYTVSGTNQTRMKQAKDALKAVINDLPGDMRVGLSRFNTPGGSVLTPARRLDEVIEQDVILRPIDNDSDGYEEEGTTEETFVYTPTLEFSKTTGTSTGSDTIIAEISDDKYDAIDCIAGRRALDITNHYIEIPYLYNPYWYRYRCSSLTGLVFDDLEIPNGAKITDARISLYVGYEGQRSESVDVYIENDPTPKEFSTYWPESIRGRNYFSDKINWVASASVGNRAESPNLKDLVQKVVDDSDWDEKDKKNGLSFSLSSTLPSYLIDVTKRSTYYHSARSGYSYQRPRLEVTYGDSSEITTQNIMGIKFNEIQIPSDASVDGANLKLIASEDNGNGVLTITLEGTMEPENYQEVNDNISDRPLHGTKLTFPYTNWNNGEERFFDVSGLIQSYVNDSNWCGGKDVNFIITSDGSGSVYAKDSGESQSPELSLRYSGGDENSCLSNDTVSQIQTYYDDAQEDPKNNKVNATNNKLTMKANGGLGGFVFRDVAIPSDAEITEAYMQVTTTGNTSSTKTFTLNTHVVQPNSYPIPSYSTDKKSISEGRGLWFSAKKWYISDAATDKVFSSPDISTEITSIIRSTGYKNASEKSFEIILENDSSKKFVVRSFDYSPGMSAKLIIRYEGTSGVSTLSVNGKASMSALNSMTTNESPLTVRQSLIALVDQQPANGSTPMDGSLYEVGQYFLGGAVDYGRSRNNKSGGNSSSTIDDARISGYDTYVNGTVVYPNGCSADNLSDSDCEDIYISGNPTYVTPMTDEVCETNNVILITDGEPNRNSNYATAHKNYNGVPLATLIRNATGVTCTDPWSCANTWVSHMYKSDFMEDKAGKSNIFTHTIGFVNGPDNLKTLANLGGGTYVTANNTDQLVDSLNLVISSIMQIESSMATPGVAVNQNNRTEHLSDIYYSVFQPAITKAWLGNLKKYQMSAEKETIVDRYSEPAVNPDTGFFEEDTTSYWSTSPDGGVVEDGGAANQQKLGRTVLTYTGSDKPNEVKLNVSDHQISKSNNKLTKSLFSISDANMTNAEFDQFIDWLSGIDVYDEDLDGFYSDSRKRMGDPLHSRPILISYGSKDIVYVSTNEGFLHAIDTATGEEEFSFIPQELLENSPVIYAGGSGEHIYGLDSSWVAWRKDVNKDGLIQKADGDFVYLYSGMRRGGDTFYALDVTDYNNPILKFIKSPDNTDFGEIGQTWSEPALAKIKVNGTEKAVVMFSAGYDVAYDNEAYVGLTDNSGNAFYMMDAHTGELIHKTSGIGSGGDAQISGMNYSMPSKPTLLDFDGDGYVDQIYLTDMASQIFKLSINNDNKGKYELVSGKIIARFGKSTGNLDIENARMMYDSVAVAPIRQDGEKYIAIVAATGYRAHPLNTQKEDVIVVIKDKEDYYVDGEREEINSPIEFNDLFDATNEMDSSTAKVGIAAKKGYYIKLQEKDGSYIGEKGTGNPLIYDNQIYLTTYVPNEDTSECVPVIGYSRGYEFDLASGTSSTDKNGDGVIDEEDRYNDQVTTGIANGSQIIYTEDGNYLLTNTDVKSVSSGGSMGSNKKRWYIEKNVD